MPDQVAIEGVVKFFKSHLSRSQRLVDPRSCLLRGEDKRGAEPKGAQKGETPGRFVCSSEKRFFALEALALDEETALLGGAGECGGLPLGHELALELREAVVEQFGA